MFISAVLAALIVGFFVGFLTFRAKLRWCRECGSNLKCPWCARQPVAANQRSF